MSLLFLESCEAEYSRWNTEGGIAISSSDGLVCQKAFVIYDATSNFQNKIERQFRDTPEYVNQRRFRLSFWIKTNRSSTKDSEFISVISKKENQGGIIGIDKNGRFYAGYLTTANEWQGKYVKPNVDQPSVTDGKYHFVELNISWDNSDAAHIIINVDNKNYINKLGVNVFDTQYCWSRPDTIIFGNLTGTDLFLDDIIMWDDTGNEYVGPKGPKRIQLSSPKSFQESSIDICKKYLYETFISNQTQAGMVTLIASEDAGSTSNVSVLYQSTNKFIKGATASLVSENDTVVSLHTGSENDSRILIGFEKS